MWRDPNELKFDPNQPRKDISEEVIDSLAQTYDSQDIINEPEIDKNDNIITGELRVRAAVKKGLKRIKCKLITGLTEDEIFERQVIENLHHNDLNEVDKENAIRRLWESGKYTSEAELASRIGMNTAHIKLVIELPEIRKNLGITLAQNISQRTLIAIQTLTIDEQRKIVAKINAEQLKQGTELRELVVVIKTLPQDLKTELLSIDSSLNIDMAKTIALFPEEEQRTKMIKEVKFTKKALDAEIRYYLEIVEGKRPRKKIVKDPIQSKMEKMLKLKMNFFNLFSVKYIEVVKIDEFRKKAYNILKEIYNFAKEELKKIDYKEDYQKVIEVKASED